MRAQNDFPSAPTVYVLEDDAAMRDAIVMLLQGAGFLVHPFSSAQGFLDAFAPSGPCCVVLDVRMPEMSGTSVHDELLRRGLRVPVVFVTGHGDIPMVVEAMRKGAASFLEKPFDPARLLQIVRDALARDFDQHARDRVRGSAQARLATLTARERDVLALVLDGKPNRVIADALSISAKTVEFHRAHIMRKLEVDSAAELVRFCVETGFVPPSP